jgi:HEAT repeat protein
MKRHLVTCLLTIACISAVGCTATSKAPAASSTPPAQLVTTLAVVKAETVALNEAQFTDLERYDYGKNRSAFLAIQADVDKATPGQFAAYEARLIQIMESPTASVAAKDLTSRLLVRVGSFKCVPVLAAMLTDEKNSLAANRVLSTIPDESAAVALRDALKKAEGPELAEVIASLGLRRDTKSFEAMRTFMADSDPAIARAAVVALGHVGTAGSDLALVLGSAKAAPALAETISIARIEGATRMAAAGSKKEALAIFDSLNTDSQPATIRAAAFRGALELHLPGTAIKLISAAFASTDIARQQAALAVVNDPRNGEIRDAAVGKLADLSPQAQAALLEILADHPENDLRPALVKLIGSKDGDVRMAAITGLAKFGQAGDVSLLVKIAALKNGKESDAANHALTQMTGSGVGAALAAMAGSGDAAQRTVAIKLINARGDVAAMPGLARLIGTADKAIALEAARAVDHLGTVEELPALAAVLAKGGDPAVVAAVQHAAKQICTRSADKAACEAQILPLARQGSSDDVRAGAMPILPAIGSANALASARAGLASGKENLHDAAARALTDWPSANAAPDLLQLAKSSTNPTLKVLALRGYLRLAGEAANLPDSQRVVMLRNAWGLATRADEKKTILGVLGNIPSPEALEMAQASLKDLELSAEATATTLKLAKELSSSDAARASAAFNDLLAQPNLSADVRKQVEESQHATQGLEGYIGRWLIAGPFEDGAKSGSQMFDEPLGPEKSPDGIAWRAVNIGSNAQWPYAVDIRGLWDRDNAVAYLKVNINSDKAQAAKLLLGSDDGIKAWFNGKLIASDNASRPVEEGSEKVDIQLKQGANQLLLKITQDSGGWGTCAKLTTPDGKKIVGVTSDISNP